MDDLISRQAAIDAFKKELTLGESKGNYVTICSAVGYEGARQILERLPSAQPERKTGHWIKTARWGRVYYCDQCRNYLDFDGVNIGRGSTNFCPNCGAKMGEEGKDD